MQILILAAGKSSRFKKKIFHKCLIKIGKSTIIENLINNFKEFKIKIVVGFKYRILQKKLSKYKIKFIYNNLYEKKEMLYSIIFGLKKSNTNTLVLYSDIIFNYQKMIDLLKKINFDEVTMPILNVKKKYESYNSFKNIKDKENLIINKKNYLVSIGDRPNYVRNKIQGQFMGLLYIPKGKIKTIVNNYKNFFHQRNHTTDFLNFLAINKIIKIKCVKYNYYWNEFDDLNDLKLYNKKLNY